MWLYVPFSSNHKKTEYISFHLIRMDVCSALVHHLQVIVLSSYCNTICINIIYFFFLVCTYFTKTPRSCSSGILRANIEKGLTFPPAPSFTLVLNLTEPLGCLPEALQNKQLFQCDKAESKLGCPSNLLCSICF